MYVRQRHQLPKSMSNAFDKRRLYSQFGGISGPRRCSDFVGGRDMRVNEILLTDMNGLMAHRSPGERRKVLRLVEAGAGEDYAAPSTSS